ncbi:KIN11 [Symbiodinium microadriaticum]|nr:KIN11 [Symbiodinium microadriaticum]
MESAQSGQEWPEGGAALALRTAPSHRAAAAEARSSRGHPSLALARELGIRRLHGSLVDPGMAPEAGSLSKSRGHRLSRHQGRAWADRRARDLLTAIGNLRNKAFAESLDADKLVKDLCHHAASEHDMASASTDMVTLAPDEQNIGRGQFASVNMAKHVKTGDTLAVKIINTSRMDPAKIQREIDNQRGLRHPNIIQLMEVIESDGKVFVFMERGTGGDLFELIIARNRLQDKEARCYFRQIVDAVGFCHRNCICHRDLKPENIFLDSNMNIKLGDFGLSSKFEWGIPLTESVGSPNYAAPELLQRACSYQGPEVDVWAAGCVLYAMITGTLPFDADRTDALFKLIKSGTYRMPGYVSAEAQDVISKMLVIDREARASMAEIRSHCWLKEEVKILVPNKQEVNESVDHTHSNHSTLLAKMLLAMAEGTHPVSRKIRSCRSFGHVTAKRRASQSPVLEAVWEFVDDGWPDEAFRAEGRPLKES